MSRELSLIVKHFFVMRHTDPRTPAEVTGKETRGGLMRGETEQVGLEAGTRARA